LTQMNLKKPSKKVILGFHQKKLRTSFTK